MGMINLFEYTTDYTPSHDFEVIALDTDYNGSKYRIYTSAMSCNYHVNKDKYIKYSNKKGLSDKLNIFNSNFFIEFIDGERVKRHSRIVAKIDDKRICCYDNGHTIYSVDIDTVVGYTELHIISDINRPYVLNNKDERLMYTLGELNEKYGMKNISYINNNPRPRSFFHKALHVNDVITLNDQADEKFNKQQFRVIGNMMNDGILYLFCEDSRNKYRLINEFLVDGDSDALYVIPQYCHKIAEVEKNIEILPIKELSPGSVLSLAQLTDNISYRKGKGINYVKY